MIWAASTFNNELDVLEIRLRTLDAVVDRFVLAEAPLTQRGQEKPLHFQENRERFAPWLHKIEHVIVEDMPLGDGWEASWERERHQRNALERGFRREAAVNDVVLISDLDEIPDSDDLVWSFDVLHQYRMPTKFLMDMFVYRLNWRWLDRGCMIGSTATVFLGGMFEGWKVHDVLLSWPLRNTTPGVAGWHLSYMGDVAHIRNKMVTMADNFYEQLIPPGDERSRDDFLTDEWIQASIDTGRDVYDREYRPAEWVGLDQLPPCVQEDPARFSHLLIDEPANPIAILRCTCGAYYNGGGHLSHFPHCEVYEEATA